MALQEIWGSYAACLAVSVGQWANDAFISAGNPRLRVRALSRGLRKMIAVPGPNRSRVYSRSRLWGAASLLFVIQASSGLGISERQDYGLSVSILGPTVVRAKGLASFQVRVANGGHKYVLVCTYPLAIRISAGSAHGTVLVDPASVPPEPNYRALATSDYVVLAPGKSLVLNREMFVESAAKERLALRITFDPVVSSNVRDKVHLTRRGVMRPQQVITSRVSFPVEVVGS